MAIGSRPLIDYVFTSQCGVLNFGSQKTNLTSDPPHQNINSFLVGGFVSVYYGMTLKRGSQFIIDSPGGLNIFSGTKTPPFTISYYDYWNGSAKSAISFTTDFEGWGLGGLFYYIGDWFCDGKCIIVSFHPFSSSSYSYGNDFTRPPAKEGNHLTITHENLIEKVYFNGEFLQERKYSVAMAEVNPHAFTYKSI